MKNPKPISSDLNLKTLISTRRTKLFAYGFLFSFIGCTAFLAFNPSNNSSSPWFHNLFSSPSTSSLKASIAPYRSQVSSLFSHFFPNSSSSSASNRIDRGRGSWFNGGLMENRSRDGFGPQGFDAGGIGVLGRNQTVSSIGSKANEISSTSNGVSSKTQKESKANCVELGKNQTVSSNGSKGSGVSEQKRGKNQSESGTLEKNQTAADRNPVKSNGVSEKTQKESKANSTETEKKSSGEIPVKSNGVSEKTQKESKANPTNATSSQMKNNGKKKEKWIEDMIGCDLFHGHWVKDESYPLYPEGSCPHIDEPFDCYLNGRPDRSYQKLRWQPTGCNIPRLNATDMLERLRGKRLVFVGDSLNRNMWESLVCVLRNSVKDKKKVFEASGRHEFRTEGSYSFLFKDYGATVEFFRSPFLVQEWEMPSGNGTKETLRLDIIERSSSKYKDAHVIIFNTGHWWTHEKTSKGKDYYQEGNKVYSELNVVDAFHKALNTWAKWIDANVNPNKSFVFFRGYSASHFSGGQWNSGGACDKETEPIQKEEYLSSYPSKMSILESVIKGMKTQVAYLNITRMTDYRKDAHPSVYRKQNLTEEERNDPLRFQDCSHWCLPGVPDSWNELLYAQLIIKQYQMAQKVG